MIVKESGSGVQGHQRTAEENARAVLHVQQHCEKGLSFDVAVKATAAAEIASPTTIRTAILQFNTTGSLVPPEDQRSHRSHPFYKESGPSLAAELLIHHRLQQVADENTYESCTTLRDELKQELGISLHKSTIHRWLHALGYQYGKKCFSNQPAAYRNALIRGFIYQYAAALKEEEEGRAIIVYMDESYVHAHHCTKCFWFSILSNQKDSVRGDNKGKRLIIMHAMTKDGMLEVEGVEPSNILTELYHSCSLIFNEVCVDDITPADYHDTINGEKFIGWIRQRLLPTFQRVYPGKKMYLVLDNAKYHHHRGPDWFSPSVKKKGQLADFLRQRQVKSVTVEGGRVIPASKFSADARGKASGGPTLDQLKNAVKQHLVDHPDINTTVPQQLFSDAGYSLIYTPPYVSDLQPIEMIWAFTKALVAKQSTRNRTVREAAIQTRKAMDQVTKELCKKVVGHAQKWMDQFIKSDDGGSLQQFADLKTLTAASIAMHQAAANDTAYTTWVPQTADEEEEEEQQTVSTRETSHWRARRTPPVYSLLTMSCLLCSAATGCLVHTTHRARTHSTHTSFRLVYHRYQSPWPSPLHHTRVLLSSCTARIQCQIDDWCRDGGEWGKNLPHMEAAHDRPSIPPRGSTHQGLSAHRFSALHRTLPSSYMHTS
jgi:transposase